MIGNPSVSSGIRDLKIFKATQSGFEGKNQVRVVAISTIYIYFISFLGVTNKVLFEIVSLLCNIPRTVLSVAKSTSSMTLMKMCMELTSMEHGLCLPNTV